MGKLILLGGGGHCESVIEVISSLKEHEIEGVLDPDFNNGLKSVLNFPVLGNDNKIPFYAEKGYQFVITVGQIKSSRIREKLFSEVKKYGGTLPKIIAPTSYVSKTSSLGEGTVVLNGVIINVGCSIGVCCIINSGSLLEHGCHVGDFTHVSTKAVLNGGVSCGNQCFIGSGVIINQNVVVGNRAIVASGSLIRKDLKNDAFVAGNPLKHIN